MPVSLIRQHTRGGQYVAVDDQVTFHNDRRVVTVAVGRDSVLELDVEDDRVLIEHLIEALRSVLDDGHPVTGVAA